MGAAGLLKAFDEGRRQPFNGNRRHQTPADVLKATAEGKLLAEVADPPGKGWPRDPEERLQTPQGVAAGAALAQRGDH